MKRNCLYQGIALWKMKANRNSAGGGSWIKPGIALWKMKANRNFYADQHVIVWGIALWKMKANRNLASYVNVSKVGIALWKMKANRNKGRMGAKFLNNKLSLRFSHSYTPEPTLKLATVVNICI